MIKFCLPGQKWPVWDYQDVNLLGHCSAILRKFGKMGFQKWTFTTRRIKFKSILGRELSFVCLLAAVFTQTSAQESVRLSSTTQIQDREILADESHYYTFSAEAGQFLLLSVEQKGIDLQVIVRSPDSDSLDFDSPNGDYGPEIVPITVTAAGIYQFTVRAITGMAAPQTGHYNLQILRYEPAANTPDGKIDQLFSAWDREDCPGASVAVVKDGRIIFRRGYGSANLEYRQPLQPSSVFQVASVSKQFTAFAIATLVTEGQISLQDPVNKHIPGFPDFGAPVTIAHLVHHTSGLRDLFSFLALAGWNGDDYISKDHILKMVKRQRELNFVPGTAYSYSNTGYVLMGEIVMSVTGIPFPEWIQKKVFIPLQMHDSFINDSYTRLIPNRANAYFSREGNYHNDLLVYSSIGETGLYTTVEDLAKWVINFETQTVGSQAVHKLMMQRGILNNGDTISYAFGLRNSEYRGLKTVTHSGSHSGYRTFMGVFPEDRLGVIVFSNAGGAFSPAGTAYAIAEIYLEGKMSPKKQEEQEPIKEKESTFESKDLESYTGTYFSREAETFYHLTVEEGQLVAHHFRHEDIPLKPVGKDHFEGDSWFFDKVDFIVEQGTVTGFRVSSNRTRNVLFEKQ